MIEIKIVENGVFITGHAGFDEPGKDIVCSAVSAILQTAQIGLALLSQQYPDFITILNEISVEEETKEENNE